MYGAGYFVDGMDADINRVSSRRVHLISISRYRPGPSKRASLLSQVTLRRNKVPAAT